MKRPPPAQAPPGNFPDGFLFSGNRHESVPRALFFDRRLTPLERNAWQVDGGQRQAVLDEWEARCRDGKIRRPAGYLFGIVQKALRGEFKVWAGSSPGTAAPGPPDPPATDDRAEAKPASPEAAREYLTHIRAILRGAPYLPNPP